MIADEGIKLNFPRRKVGLCRSASRVWRAYALQSDRCLVDANHKTEAYFCDVERRGNPDEHIRELFFGSC